MGEASIPIETRTDEELFSLVLTGNTSSTFAQPVAFLYTDILRAVQ